MAYEPYQRRVIAERDEFNRRVIILKDFINPRNPVYADLGEREKFLANYQVIIMRDLLSLLDERISMFGQ
jgi:hypothetical protein